MNIEKIKTRLTEIDDEISALEKERGDLISTRGKIRAQLIRTGSHQ